MSSVELIRLAKRFGKTDVVRGIDLAIAEGEFVVLLGPSGCGKTTTLRMIAGFVEPTAGDIRLGGALVNNVPSRHRNLGMVFQDYALFPNMSVRDNIAFGLVERKAPRALIDQRTAEMATLIRMEALLARYPAELSGGQKQRVALARALAYRPGVLLMDEPLGALDQKLREDMQREFRALQREVGITTVFVTHDQEEAMILADRIVVMNNGQIEQTGTAEDLYRRPQSLFVASFIGRTNRLDGVIEHVANSGVTLRLTDGTLVHGTGRNLAAGTRGVGIIRPEAVRLTPVRPVQGNGIECRIKQQRFLGERREVTLSLPNGSTIIARTDAAEPLPEAAAIHASFVADDLCCFAAEQPK